MGMFSIFVKVIQKLFLCKTINFCNTPGNDPILSRGETGILLKRKKNSIPVPHPQHVDNIFLYNMDMEMVEQLVAESLFYSKHLVNR